MWEGVDTSTAHQMEAFLVYALIDTTALQSVIGTVSDTVLVVPEQLQHHLEKMLSFNLDSLQKYREKLEKRLVCSKVQECSNNLQMVSAIPRIYRRTNKSPPKEPSGYMTEVVGVVATFCTSNARLMGKHIENITDGLVLEITER